MLKILLKIFLKMKNKIIELKKLIENSEKILLINHIKMDADAFWSLAAFYLILEKIWKKVKAINDSETPKDFDFLLEKRIIESDLYIKKFSPDLIISLDAASTSQLWETFLKNENIFKNTNFVVIDHHQTNIWFWNLNLIFPKYSSTCELLFDIFEEIWFLDLIDNKIATLIISGIYTDTNIFYNQNTTPNTHKVAARLLELKADFRSPIYNFFQKISLKRLKLFWKAIQNLQKEKNLIYGFLEKKDFLETDTTLEDTSWIINKLSNIEENEVICMIYETENWTKISFRSKNIDVWSFCASFPNWWWHKNAAGFNLEKNLEEAKKIILEKFEKYFN